MDFVVRHQRDRILTNPNVITQLLGVNTQVSSDDPMGIVHKNTANDLREIWRRHWGQGGLETGDYMLSTFRAHVHLSHNVTGG